MRVLLRAETAYVVAAAAIAACAAVLVWRGEAAWSSPHPAAHDIYYIAEAGRTIALFAFVPLALGAGWRLARDLAGRANIWNATLGWLSFAAFAVGGGSILLMRLWLEFGGLNAYVEAETEPRIFDYLLEPGTALALVMTGAALLPLGLLFALVVRLRAA